MFVFAFLPFATASAVLPPRPVDVYSNVGSNCAKSVELPKPSGPYGVGTAVFHFVDDARPENGTLKSEDWRQVEFQLWYPAEKRRRMTVAYVPELELMRLFFKADSRAEPQKIARDLEQYACVQTNSYADAPAAPGNEKFPVLVFSPGGNMSRHWHTAQAEEFASNGYIVLVLSHAFSGLDVFPGLPVMVPERWGLPKDASSVQQMAQDNAMSEELALDARFALDRLEDVASGVIPHALRGRIDMSKVAIAGHSRGGKTVGRACADDARFKACVTYDNIAPDREQATGLRTPQLTIRTPWSADREQILHDYLRKNQAFAGDIQIKGASHFTFTDLTIVDPNNFKDELAPTVGLKLANQITLEFLDAVFGGRKPSFAGFHDDSRLMIWQP